MRRAFLLLAVLCAGSLPALLNPEVFTQVSALHALAEAPNPYFVPEQGQLLYLWAPLVALSACLFFLSPGLLLALAFNRGTDTGQWLLAAMVLSLPAISIPTAIVQSVMDEPLRGAGFVWVVVACCAFAFAVLLFRLRRNPPPPWPLENKYDRTTAVMMLFIPLLLAAALTPKIYWENFTRDGLQVLESARLLYFQPLPFWPEKEGIDLNYPAFNAMLSMFIPSWFVRMFGEIEASIRLPYLLYLSVLFGTLLSLVNYGRKSLLKFPEQLLIWFALITCTVVVIYNATYNPYAADIAHPAAREIFLTALFVGFVLYFLKAESVWMIYFLALVFITLPLGSFLMGLFWIAVVLLWEERPWKMLTLSAIAAAGCVALSLLAPMILQLFHHSLPGHVFSAENLLQRMHLSGGSIQKFAFLLIPGGIVPVVSLLMTQGQDRLSRALTLAILVYFAFFFVQKQTSLNHYVPIMILPLIVFWRNTFWMSWKLRPYLLALTAIFTLLAFIISLPHQPRPDISSRIIGSTIEDRIGGYETLDFEALRRQEILGLLFPAVFHRSVPEKQYGGVPWVWYHYAHRHDHALRNINYIIQRSSDPPPADAYLFREIGAVSLYVRNKSIWKEHRRLRPPSPSGNKIYAIPKENLYQTPPGP